jgi:uncharacterized protein with HEPN domain
MTGPTLLQFLEHMAEYGREAREFAQGLTEEEFGEDRKTLYAVLNALQAVGEAAGRVSQAYPQFVARHPEVPWRLMTGMRNRLAHGYFEVRVDVVWGVLTKKLPALEESLPAVREDAVAYLRSLAPDS